MTTESTPILDVRNVVVGYGAAPILRDVSIRIDRGEIVALVGPNGAGKTTSVRAILGMLRLTSGEVMLDGSRITGEAPWRIARSGVAFVPQGGGVFGWLSVRQNLLMGAAQESRVTASNRLDEVVELFPVLGKRTKQSAGTLSGGERQMLSMGRALMSSPRLLLLDEPSLGLAPRIIDELLGAIIRLRETQNLSVLLVEQNARKALAICDRVSVLRLGEIVLEESDPASLLNDDRVLMAYLR